ncbi:type 1 glutamine amidotransferase domain-containing protein [Agromyces sp. MMS24-K17]|uniref:type 1 glutamine amidotransferase domain-containing protein n=1 Tax=Agromyces sp. MMS24-K17 TaxID=3372850 RepID=UPI0037544686
MTKVLMAVTGVDRMTLADGTSHPTGFWAEELLELHRGLTAAGHDVQVATPGARAAVADPASLDPATDAGRRMQADLDALAGVLAHPRALADVADGEFDAIVLPGGHGPMADLATDADLGRLLVDAVDRDAVIGVLCHGPAGLLSAVRPDGTFAFAERRLTVFTDAEEHAGGLGENSPYLVESRLVALGAIVESGEPWSSTVVTDGRLVSGQNPQSSAATAAAVVTALG